jgi:ribosome hibernation promoting factor
MEIAIHGHKIEVPAGLRTTVEDKLARLDRFLDGLDRAEVRFSEERNPRIADREVCEVTIHGHGHVVRARAAAADPFGAIDLVMDKLEHRMERLKGRLLDRSHPRRHGSVHSESRTEADEGDAGESDGSGVQAKIVETKAFHIKPMTPEEAALQMQLVGHDFVFFTNSETERPAVIYRRSDGNVGLIDAM